MEKCIIISENDLDIFKQPARVLVAGYSNSGKTVLITKLCLKYQHKFSKIIVSSVDDVSHPLSKIGTLHDKITPIKGLINPADFQDPYTKESILYIIDDLFLEAVQSQIIANIFIRGRHEGISVLLVSQNVFPQGKFARTICLNCSLIFC